MRTMRAIRQDGLSLSAQQRLLAVFAPGLAVALLAVSWLDDKLERRRSRRLLQELTDHQLKDIGISRADAFNEGQRPFWD